MNTDALITAAAAIAGHLATSAFATGGVSPGKIQELARTAVQIVREIEKEAAASRP